MPIGKQVTANHNLRFLHKNGIAQRLASDMPIAWADIDFAFRVFKKRRGVGDKNVAFGILNHLFRDLCYCSHNHYPSKSRFDEFHADGNM